MSANDDPIDPIDPIDFDAVERQLRAEIVDADVRDPVLDAFLARIPKMKTSDIICLLSDEIALSTQLRMSSRYPDKALMRSIAWSALLALKDEIDRRFPIPEAPR